MRNAFELAHGTATMFVGGSSAFVGLDEITFKRPVPIGSILLMRAHVVYSKEDHFHIRIVADVADPFDTSKVSRTNVFWFTFAGSNKRVVPRSYTESMLYIEGKRRMK